MGITQPTIQSPASHRSAPHVPVVLAGLILLQVFAVLLGWQFKIESLKHLNPSWVAMNPTTAACFLATAILLLLDALASSRLSLNIARALAAAVALLAILRIIACLGGPDLRVDQLLYPSQLPNGGVTTPDGHVLPSRIAPNTALLLFLSAAALFLAASRKRIPQNFARGLALAVAFLSVVGAIGYFNGVTVLYRPTALIPMAIHTILAFLLLSAGILALPDAQPHAALTPVHAAIEARIKRGFGVALFLLAIIGVVTYSSVQSFSAATATVEHTRRVLSSISQLSNDLSDIESGERGFVISGNESFLANYHRGLIAAETHLNELNALIADNPPQVQRLDDLRPLIDDERAFMQKVVEARRSQGPDAAVALVNSRNGQRLMDEIHGILALMRDTENVLQDQRSIESAHSEDITLFVITLGTLIAFSLVAAAAWIIRREFVARYRLDQELAAARAAADEANAAKSRFLANMSHEIRTPMSAILGYADLILDPDQTPSDRLEYVNTIRRNGDHLLTVINDILDLSKIEAGKIQIELVLCSPCRILADVASLMRVRAVEKKISLEIRNEGPIPAVIRTDPIRLRQILINLLSNAVKFTEQGSVRVIMRLDESPQSPPSPTAGQSNASHPNATLHFDIIDTGIGMNPDQLSLLFQPFVQADSSTTRRFGGSGLGLTIVKRLVEFLGGTITVQSLPNRGSTFSFFIDPGPLDNIKRIPNCREALLGADPEKNAPAAPALAGNVLLVDDGEDNRRLLSVYLRQAGMHVALAENGRIGVEKALAALHQQKPFDVILMDMQMPELDGYGAAAKLRSKGYRLPIIALTAHAMAEDRARCLSAGCDDYLSKPVRRQDLLSTVARHLPGGAPPPGAPLPPPSEINIAPAPDPSVNGIPALPTLIRSDLSDESLRPHLDAYVRNLPTRVAEIQSALARQDRDLLLTKIHNLKGTGGLYGLMPLTHAAAKIEKLLLQKTPLEELSPLLHALLDTLQRVEGYPHPGPQSGADAPVG